MMQGDDSSLLSSFQGGGWGRIMLLVVLLGMGGFSGAAGAQDMINDIFAGKLIEPEVGVYAWYDLTDATTNKTLFLRLAVVGHEKIKRKEAWWVETQLVPQVGFPVVYKMLLTGPANDPDNIHEILVQQQGEAVQKVPVPPKGDEETQRSESDKVPQGTVEILTPEGPVAADHFVVKGKAGLW